jgi:hypothetical protein
MRKFGFFRAGPGLFLPAGLALGQAIPTATLTGKVTSEGCGPSRRPRLGDLSGAPGPAGVCDRRLLYTTKSSLRSIPLNKEVD